MPRRQNVIAHSIADAIVHDEDKKRDILARISSFFWLYYLELECVNENLFKSLRGIWQIDDEDYRKSFGHRGSAGLTAAGDMGYSGSTFFRTNDSAYLIKSIPRRFEHSFFKQDLVLPYAEHMQNEPHSLLIRITDFLECSQTSLGFILASAPSHHIVMENILYGEDQDRHEGDELKWESWDLKPMSYFYPERDVAGGKLSSEATKSKLADEFNDKIVLTLDDIESFKMQLQKDTKLLAKRNAVDYSLFLVRIPCSDAAEVGSSTGSGPLPPRRPPFVPPGPPSWRSGIRSADGKYFYRAAILDFFWAKHKVHAKAMTSLINTYNVFDRQGPMSVTAEPAEYRERFLKMCLDMLEEHPEHLHQGERYRDPKTFRRGR